MIDEGQLVYGLVVAVDIEGFSHMSILDQITAPARLDEILELAARRAQLIRAKWVRQSRGDGELAVLPPDTDVARVVADFTHQIVEELKFGGRPRLRLRISMHHGTLAGGAFGPVGDTVVVACRLLDAKEARETLAVERDDDVVFVVSRRLYQDVVATRFHGLRPDRFRPLSECAKGRTYRGFICSGSPKSAPRSRTGVSPPDSAVTEEPVTSRPIRSA